MRTQMMNDAVSASPWLEFVAPGEHQPQKCEIHEFPFTIGRDPSVDLTLDSNRVSRQHAEITRAPEGGCLVRDLNSTNGTSVNGAPVSEATLGDGDVLTLADIDLTFYAGGVTPKVDATQVMTQPVSGRQTDSCDLILQVRRLHETLTHRSIGSRFEPIVEMSSHRVFGYQALRWFEEGPNQQQQAESIIAGTECRLTERINQQHRLVAAELARNLSEPTHLFFALQVSEVSADLMPDSLGQLVDIVDGRHQLVAEIPETAACDIPYFRQFVDRLRERGIAVAYAGFCGGPAQVSEWGHVAPDYLKLAATLVKGISRASGGWRKTQSLVQATQDLNCDVIAVGIEDEADAQCLVELGCRFGQGARFGTPQPVSALVTPQMMPS